MRRTESWVFDMALVMSHVSVLFVSVKEFLFGLAVIVVMSYKSHGSYSRLYSDLAFEKFRNEALTTDIDVTCWR
jgi:hypothetical protein